MTPGDDAPLLRVDGAPEGALAPAVLRQLDGAPLARFLAAQRWFGGKGTEPRLVRVAEVVPVDWENGHAAVVRLEIESDPGDRPPVSYQLPLIVREAEMSAMAAPRAIVARVDAGGVRALLFDAIEDAAFRAMLGSSFSAGALFSAPDGASWRIEAVGGGDLAAEPARLGSAEQSNSSIVYGDRAMLKLFRRLDAGEHPDLEVVRFLTTRTTFTHTPALLGAIHLRDATGTNRVAGMLTRYLPGSVDGWSYALESLRELLRARRRGAAGGAETSAAAHGTSGTGLASSNGAAPEERFAADARALGHATRELHDALASDPTDPDFAPRPAGALDVATWASNARRSVEQGMTLLAARAPALDAGTRPMATAIASRGERVLEHLARLAHAAGEAAPGQLIRHHGDFHLGQVLRTREGEWMIIDFEGEPARPLAERRQRNSPYRDVAGMLRSFAYASAVAVAEVASPGSDPAAEMSASRWEREARRAFLEGYDAPAESDSIIALFELEKLFYELAYELNNRPDWVWIPLRGVAKLF